MTSIANIGQCEELPDQLPENMFLHPKLIFNVPRIAMEQFMDPQRPVRNEV